ncbi:MAG: class D beta-lactamase [Candidatus Riflebacteria bacterium]|nr:class D beta-lactamase [Candidatus Riflebacteria bacterium]
MKRQEAWELLQSHLKQENLIKHSISTLVLIFLIFSPIQSIADQVSSGKIDFAPFFVGHDTAFVFYDLEKNEYIRLNSDKCKQRFSPCSTFKIPNSLIALETGIASDANFSLKWDGKINPIKTWNQDHNLKSAFSESCLWFFREIASRVGTETMNKFVNDMDYGNRDTSGGLTQFWLDSTLKISPDEQIEFLKKLCTNRLPFSNRSVKLLKEIMLATQTVEVSVYGKTGTAGDPIKGATMGWYVGFLEKSAHTYIFAANISGGDNPSGRKARQIVFEILRSMKFL